MKNYYPKVLKKLIFSFLLHFLFIGMLSSNAFFQEPKERKQDFNQFKGKVVNHNTKKPLIFATLAIENTNISTITNTEGQFQLKVPKTITNGNVIVTFLGYVTEKIPLSTLSASKNNIALRISITELSGVNITVPKNVRALVLETLNNKGVNYFKDPTLMTAFYRETIKKRKKNVSLSEAVVNIYKTPYNSFKKDAIQLYKARKSTNYSKLDTLTLKLQGGPFNTLFADIMKYPEYIFREDVMDSYKFTFNHSTKIDNKLIFVINFEQYNGITSQLYKGKLYIDAHNKTLTSAIYSLNITNKHEAARLFIRKKPSKAKVWPTEVAYRVDYREKDNKWHYGYSNVLLEFKVDWDDRFFNSVYSMSCEMAVTDWKRNSNNLIPKGKDKLKPSVILSDEAIGFSDPNFWGEYNIIEPNKSIESAIKKINRQLKKIKTTTVAVNL